MEAMTHGVTARTPRKGDPLVGRADELDLLEGLLDELDHGAPVALEVVGEPGIGKTRLLSELDARAELRGYVVLTGSASELERELPFSVFVHALDQYLESLEPGRLSGLDADVQAELAHVFPSLAALEGEAEPAPQHERYRSHRAVRALLEVLLRDRLPRVRRRPIVHHCQTGRKGGVRQVASVRPTDVQRGCRATTLASTRPGSLRCGVRLPAERVSSFLLTSR